MLLDTELEVITGYSGRLKINQIKCKPRGEVYIILDWQSRHSILLHVSDKVDGGLLQ